MKECKAFNTLDHAILLKELDLYGLRGVCNEWLEDYLANRSLVTKISTIDQKIVKSDIFNVTHGMAQGSCLGPLLFILFCNNIHRLPTYSKIIPFTNDSSLLYSHKNVSFLRYALEHDMKLLADWYRANKLSLNVAKMYS